MKNNIFRVLMLVACLFVVNNLYSQLPEKGDYKTRVGIKAPTKVQDWMQVVFNRPPYTDPHAEVDSLSYVEFYRAFKSLADNAPYVDYTFYSGAFSEPQVDRNTNKVLEKSIYDKLLLNFQDPAIRLLIIEDILSLGRNFIDNLDSVNVVRNNRDTLEKAADDTLSLPVAMTKYAHLYYKYAGNPKYYPAHLYDKEQAREYYRNAFRMLVDNNINPGDELEAFYVREYYNACEDLYKSDTLKYFKLFIEDYLDIVETCDNLLRPYMSMPDSSRNKVDKYVQFNEVTNLQREITLGYDTINGEAVALKDTVPYGIKLLFPLTRANDPKRISDFYISQLPENRRNYEYLERALYVMNELGCNKTKAFLDYSEASYAIKPSYLNSLGCAFVSKELDLLSEMFEYYRQADSLAPDTLHRALIYYYIAEGIEAKPAPLDSNAVLMAQDSKEHMDWYRDLTVAETRIKELMKYSAYVANSVKLDYRAYLPQAALQYLNIKRFKARGTRDESLLNDALDYVRAFPYNFDIAYYEEQIKGDRAYIKKRVKKPKPTADKGPRMQQKDHDALQQNFNVANSLLFMAGAKADRAKLKAYEDYYNYFKNSPDLTQAERDNYEKYKHMKKINNIK